MIGPDWIQGICRLGVNLGRLAFVGLSDAGQVTLFWPESWSWGFPKLCHRHHRLSCSKDQAGSMFSRRSLAKGLWRRVNSRLSRVSNGPGGLESPNTNSAFPGGSPFYGTAWASILRSLWLLFFHLDRIAVLRDSCASVPRLWREHFLMVTISSQIKRDLEMSEWFSSWTLSPQA